MIDDNYDDDAFVSDFNLPGKPFTQLLTNELLIRLANISLFVIHRR